MFCYCMYKYINIYSLRENLIVRAPNVCLLGLLVLINQLLRSKPQIFATIKERKKERKIIQDQKLVWRNPGLI